MTIRADSRQAMESVFNQFTSGILYFFPGPRAGLFSVKIRKKFLAIINFSVNETKSGQPNKLRFSLTFRELNGKFLYYGCLSSTQLDVGKLRQPIIDQHPVEQTAYRREIKDYGYKSVLKNSWLVRERNGSWIKGLRKNPQKSELVHCLQFLLSRATEPWPHGLREMIACI